MLPKPETRRPMKRRRKSRYRRRGVMSTVAKRHHSARCAGSGSSMAANHPGMNVQMPGYAQDVMEKATFAGGCFWGVEHLFNELPGVIDAVSGYSGRNRDNPSYAQACSGRPAHAAAMQ